MEYLIIKFDTFLKYLFSAILLLGFKSRIYDRQLSNIEINKLKSGWIKLRLFQNRSKGYLKEPIIFFSENYPHGT